MARTKKPESLEEQLLKVEDDITTMQENLKKLKKTKKELQEKIRINRLEKLDKMIDSSGKSYDEVEQLLSK
ncbi:MAG: flagellar export protein FliJ [Eubacterium sp.]|nr:flagellar export protein FliJ [Eubacterium sp.]